MLGQTPMLVVVWVTVLIVPGDGFRGPLPDVSPITLRGPRFSLWVALLTGPFGRQVINLSIRRPVKSLTSTVVERHCYLLPSVTWTLTWLVFGKTIVAQRTRVGGKAEIPLGTPLPPS